MWVKEGHKVDRPSPPQETGERLLTFPRPDGAELRVSLDEFNGHNFISLRVWEPARDGSGVMWPTKKGVTVRLRECGDLARVLTKTAGAVKAGGPVRGFAGGGSGETRYESEGQGAAMTEHHAAEQTPKFIDKGRPIRPPWDAEKLRPAGQAGGGGDFNEF
jgi:hypothetical protein